MSIIKDSISYLVIDGYCRIDELVFFLLRADARTSHKQKRYLDVVSV